MEYQTFIKTVKTELEQLFCAPVEITLDHHLKNNSVEMDSITIRNPKYNIAPTIYLNPYYARHLDGVSMEDILFDIKRTYEKSAPCRDFDVSKYTDYAQAKKSICMRLIHYERNRELLRETPHIRIEDLAVVFSYLLPMESDTSASIPVRRTHTMLWNVTAEQLFQQAIINSPRLLPVQIHSMEDLLMKMTFTDFPKDFESPIPMYVASNARNIYGASVILYPDFLDDLAEDFESDLTIIPSSVHEVIIIPDQHPDPVTLTAMIQEVNELELTETEILSDHPYFYSRVDHKLHSEPYIVL